MPTFYNFRQNGLDYSFDDIFVPADLFREGNLWNWGGNSSGRLGTGPDTANKKTPVTTFAGGNNWKQISNTSAHTAAIKTDGTLWLWGSGTNGRLGNGFALSRSTPVTTFAGGNNWKQVSSGNSHTTAIKTDGTLWMWGSAGNGRLGNAVITGDINTPVTTFAGGTNWKQVSCGSNYTSAIKTDGTLWIWGDNTSSQLGTNDTTQRNTPVTTFAGGNNWKQVANGNTHTVAIKTDGTLWIWGDNTSSKLGIANTGTRSTPVTTFAGGNNWKQAGADSQTTRAIKTDGTLWGWGSGGNGSLGNAQTTNRATPVTTFAGGNNWKQVSEFGPFAIKTDGTLWAWGFNSNGELGIDISGIGTNRSTPVTTFAGGTNWKQVSSRSAIQYIDPVI